MIPALIIIALATLLLFAATSHARSTAERFSARDHGTSTTFVSFQGFKLIGVSPTSTRTPSGNRRASLSDHITNVILTTIHSCKSQPARHDTFRWPQPIPLAENFIRPTG